MERSYIGTPRSAWTAVELEPFTAVYHRASGITHLLVEPAPQLLDVLGAAELSLAELRARLADRFDLPDVTDEALIARLEELVEAGLVARA